MEYQTHVHEIYGVGELWAVFSAVFTHS